MEGIKNELQEIEKEVNSQSYAIARKKLLKLQERTDLTNEDQIKILDAGYDLILFYPIY